MKRHALLFEHALELPRHFTVHAGKDAVQKFHDLHFRAETTPDRAKLKPDHARADHE